MACCVRACVRVCVRVRACVRACVCASVSVCEGICASLRVHVLCMCVLAWLYKLIGIRARLNACQIRFSSPIEFCRSFCSTFFFSLFQGQPPYNNNSFFGNVVLNLYICVFYLLPR